MATSTDGGDWVKWLGVGEPPSGIVRIKLRNGTEWTPSDVELPHLDWKYSERWPETDIVAYRRP